jgi:uncharacterized Fe-S center protein
MAKRDVYMTDMRAKPDRGLIDKFVTLVEKAGFKKLKLEKKFVAIKIHFGEPGNLAFIRPNYAACMAEMVSKAGGIPFLTDANTLYSGGRGSAIDHLASAAQNGFTRAVVGCEVIVADGLKGMEFREVEINQKHCRSAKIASAIADSDVIISLSHFKGHELTGFGGAVKNLGMGSGSRGGKLFMHSASKPRIIEKNCTSCAMCVKSCPQEAVTLSTDHKVATIDYDKCIGCGQCIAMCQYNAAQAVFNESAADAAEKIAEYALAVVKDRPSFHANFITDVAPKCDCYGFNDAALVADTGILASADPVALDRACVDLVNDAPVNPGSMLEGKGFAPGDDKFGAANPNTSWQAGLSYAESIGLGTQSYRLVKVE